MICDYQTNKVYLAEGIKGYPKVAENLLYALYKEGIETEYLPHSKSKKHVWARDYMPVQVGTEEFVKYVYRPDYLREDPEYIPRYGAMVKRLGLPCRETRLVMDGGNVVKGEDDVIMTDKVVRENALFKEDAVAVEQIQRFYPDHKVVLVPNCLELVRDGGALNCVTWNILEIPGQAGNDERVPTA